jgi:transcriptional regulator with XRE-family HTH domain
MPRRRSDKLIPIGRRIKKARTGKKVTFNNLANETGFSIDYLKDIEAGKVIPPVGAILQISRGWLFTSRARIHIEKPCKGLYEAYR